MHNWRLAMLLISLATGAELQSANASEGFYAGIAVGRENANVDYRKAVSINEFPASHREAKDEASRNVSAFKALLGYRHYLSNQFYLSGEVSGALHPDSRVTGFLQGEGIGTGLRDVWRGKWAFEKNHAFSVNARVGYVPNTLDFLGKGRSIYLITGVSRLDTTFESTYLKPDEIGGGWGKERRDRAGISWLVGTGVEFGDLKNRFGLQMDYSGHKIDFVSGDGTALAVPRVEYEFDVGEWGLHFSYTRSFDFNLLF